MTVKYQRTSAQQGKRFGTEKNQYDMVLFDQGISGTRPFKDRTQAKKLVELVNAGKVNELVVEDLRDIGRNMVNTINTLASLDKKEVNVVIRSMGNRCSMVYGKKNEIWGLITVTMSSLYVMELENFRTRTQMGRDACLMCRGCIGRAEGLT